ncbi:MAG: PorT family protein, partial [Bacteroidetes bacterium]|nr:PorT family protein [Bacteroidota bacterium]
MNRKQIYRLLLFTGILYLAAASANAQIIKGEIIAGFNLSQLDGDEVYGYKKAGLQLGLGAMIPISEKWDISLETLYNEKGANEKAQYPMQADSTTGAYRVKLNYLDVPLLLHFTDKEFITVGTGFSWGRLIK